MLEYKWQKYCKKYFIKDALLYTFFLIVFNINAIIFFPQKILQESKTYDNFNFVCSMYNI